MLENKQKENSSSRGAYVQVVACPITVEIEADACSLYPIGLSDAPTIVNFVLAKKKTILQPLTTPKIPDLHYGYERHEQQR
jgi:hypothetical protein